MTSTTGALIMIGAEDEKSFPENIGEKGYAEQGVLYDNSASRSYSLHNKNANSKTKLEAELQVGTM